MKGVWLQDFIEGPKNMAKDTAQRTMREMSTWESDGASGMCAGPAPKLGPFAYNYYAPGPNTPLSMGRSSDDLDRAAEEGEKVYFDGIQDRIAVLAKAMVAVQTLLHHIGIHKSPQDGRHCQEDHLLQYIKVDSAQDSEDPHEDGIHRSFIYADHTVASKCTGARHLVHAWPDQAHDPIIHGLHPSADMVSNTHGALHVHAYFEDTQELAILLGEMFQIAFYAKYEAAFLTGHWTVTDPGPLLGRVLVWKLQVMPHQDGLDAGPSIIFNMGKFTGGECYITNLKLKLKYCPGDVIILMGGALHHGIGPWKPLPGITEDGITPG
ncbi:uncharacterized protein EDB91DRAFT_1083733 [Suillus paluster]|uniref:uncharacterized protein n=1 Tax=Suillus paluster TaxID=48578 RepID=UPI001B882582|nr:uncharacterized protein EDB91DRAFT_1083733 [Suillus paluster]KAG1735277.1 hypothetical protein EDB91DRAFT_1083733 [Suillus paluster]